MKKRAETKPLGLGAPPPPAGASLEEEADPVAGLFASDKAVPAPGINDAPSEAELGRWVATSHTSLFEERVKDPAPGVSAAEPPRRASTPNPLDQELDEPVAIPGMTEPKPGPRKQRAAASAVADTVLAMQAPAEPPAAAPAPAPAVPTKSKSKNRVGSSSGARKRAAVAPAASEAEPSAPQADADLAPKARKRRIEHGPSKALLAGLGAATLLLLAAAGVLLGVVPNPLGDGRAVQPVRAAPPARAKPVAAKPVAAKPVAATTVAATPAAASAALAAPRKAPTAVPAAAPIAAANPAAKPAAASAVVAAPPPAPRAVAAPAPVRAVAPAAEAPARAPSDDEAEADSAGGGGKLAQARKLLAAENPEAAEALARQVLAADPQDHHAMDVLARSLMDQDRGADALPFAQKMVQRRGKRVPYRLLLGDLLLMVGNEAGARAEWQKALELAPNDKEIQRRLGK